MSERINFQDKSKANANFVSCIKDKKKIEYYECTIHNMYYSVFQRMKAVVCKIEKLEHTKSIKHIKHGKIRDRCKKCILKKAESATENCSKLVDIIIKKVSELYSERIKYDYDEHEPIDEETYHYLYDNDR